MVRVLTRAGYALAPVLVLGTVAASTGGGHRRMAILALGIVIGAVLAYYAAPGRSEAPEQSAAPGPAATVPAEPMATHELTPL